MLKCNGIFIYLLFTFTVAADNGRRNKRFNITLAEAAFEYDLKSDNKIIENKHKYIRTINLPTKGDKKNQKKFFDFITDAIEILMKYSDSDLEHFFIIFSDEIRKYHYRGCKFYELTENSNFRMLVARNLLLIKDKPVLLLRRYLRTMHNKIEEAKLNINKRTFLDLINGLYSHDDVTKFGKILSNLYEYRVRGTHNMDLVSIIRSGIRSALFDYYTELDQVARAKIKVSIKKYLEHYMSIVESLKIEMNNTKTNGSKENHLTDKKHVRKKTKRITLSKKSSDKDDDASSSASSVDNKSLLNKKIRQTGLRTTAVRKPSKSPDVRPIIREQRIKHNKKQIGRKGKQEYDTTEYTIISSYGVRNVTQIVDFDLPLSHNITKLTTRPSLGHKMTQIYRYEVHLNADRKIIKEPKLYLKKPEFEVHFPAYRGKEMVYNNRPNGQSLVDAPTFNHKNLINVRRMFDQGYIVKQAHRGITYLPIQTEHRHKGAKITQGQRFVPPITNNDEKRLNSDTETNKKISNTTGKVNADNNGQSQIPLTMDTNDKKLKKKEVLVDLKFNFDTLKRIITYPFDAIKNALSKKTNKPKKNTLKIKENNNKNIQINYNNIKNRTMEKPKHIDARKLKLKINNDSNPNDYRFSRPYSVGKTSTVITNMYQIDVKKQHKSFHNTTDIQTYINAKKYVLANKTARIQVQNLSTKADFYNFTQKRVKIKTKKGKSLQRFVANYLNDLKARNFRAAELPPSIYLQESNKNIKNVPDVFKIQNVMVKKNKNKDAATHTTASKTIRFTGSIDRFPYLRHLMNTYISHNNFSMH